MQNRYSNLPKSGPESLTSRSKVPNTSHSANSALLLDGIPVITWGCLVTPFREKKNPKNTSVLPVSWPSTSYRSR